MEKEFVPYEQALALKELGFDEDCLAWWNYGKFVIYGEDNLLDCYSGENNRPLAPLYQQAFRWFIEKYNIECHIKSLYEQRENKGYYSGIDDYTNRDFYSKPYYSYEEAELECIKKLIEIAKTK